MTTLALDWSVDDLDDFVTPAPSAGDVAYWTGRLVRLALLVFGL